MRKIEGVGDVLVRGVVQVAVDTLRRHHITAWMASWATVVGTRVGRTRGAYRGAKEKGPHP